MIGALVDLVLYAEHITRMDSLHTERSYNHATGQHTMRVLNYTWHPSTDSAGNPKPGGWGTLLEANRENGGYLVVHNGITYEDACRKYGWAHVQRFDRDVPVTVEVGR